MDIGRPKVIKKIFDFIDGYLLLTNVFELQGTFDSLFFGLFSFLHFMFQNFHFLFFFFLIFYFVFILAISISISNMIVILLSCDTPNCANIIGLDYLSVCVMQACVDSHIKSLLCGSCIYN